MDTSFAVFTPQEGAVLDQISLQAIASSTEYVFGCFNGWYGARRRQYYPSWSRHCR